MQNWIWTSKKMLSDLPFTTYKTFPQSLGYIMKKSQRKKLQTIFFHSHFCFFCPSPFKEKIVSYSDMGIFLLELPGLPTTIWLVLVQINNPETKLVQQKCTCYSRRKDLNEKSISKHLITEISEPRKPRWGNTANPVKSHFSSKLNIHTIWNRFRWSFIFLSKPIDDEDEMHFLALQTAPIKHDFLLELLIIPLVSHF